MKRFLFGLALLLGLAGAAQAQVVISVTNAGTTGTTNGLLAKLTGAPSTAVVAATTDTNNLIGVVVSGGGTTGSALIARSGQVSCTFDGATTAGDWVIASATTGGDCHDTASATFPTTANVQVLGRVLSTNASGGSYAMTIAASDNQITSGGGTAGTFELGGGTAGNNFSNNTRFCALNWPFQQTACGLAEGIGAGGPGNLLGVTRKLGAISGVSGAGLYVQVQTAPGVGQSYAFTVHVINSSTSANVGTGTNPTCTISGTNTFCSDTTNVVTAPTSTSSVPVMVDLQVVGSATATASGNVAWSITAQ